MSREQVETSDVGDLRHLESGILFQWLSFYEPNPGGIIHTPDDRCVATWWQGCNNRRLPWVCWSMAAVPYVLDLIAGDNPAKYRGHPIIVMGDQSSSVVVQLQCRISQWIGNSILSQLWTDRTHNDSLCGSALNNETANHHVVVRLHKGCDC